MTSNFLSAAHRIVVAIALIRGLPAARAKEIGNFWWIYPLHCGSFTDILCFGTGSCSSKGSFKTCPPI